MIQVVWFKRDLRIHDHAPLTQVTSRGPILAICVYEPTVIRAPDFAAQHLGFINESLAELDTELRVRGSRLLRFHGNMVAVLQRLFIAAPFADLWSHEETGNAVTFARDVAVAAWCKSHRVTWYEIPQSGVVRGLKDRNGWASRWEERMNLPITVAPKRITAAEVRIENSETMEAADFGLRTIDKPARQRGGRNAAADLLKSFLDYRGQNYRQAMSSPLSALTDCSRLSAHIAFGTLSHREVVQAVKSRQAALRAMPKGEAPPGFLASLKSFEGRLHWHCHFMQRLESEPEIEFQNLNRGFDGLRENDFDLIKFTAWSLGKTSYPMVDACMRMLAETGWLNFRMRSMVVSFASHHLWLHWRETALHLAREFLDYEPGIHYSQVQMQSGVTGTNTVRIYNPVKQARDQDPAGLFVRRWIPALANVPDDYIFEPWKMPLETQSRAGCMLGEDYPLPIVKNEVAARTAKVRIAVVRKKVEVKNESSRVFQKHGSRKRSNTRSYGLATANSMTQLQLDL
jgi:deoxyribodipyrimidine photo-lyase